MNRTQHPHPPSLPPAALACALLVAGWLSGCTVVGDVFGGEKVDYRSSAVKAKPLDVPPDLTQLSRDTRFQVQGGVVSAAAGGAAAATGRPEAVGSTQVVAPTIIGSVRVEREGDQRWLVLATSPDVLWPQVRAFWIERGFTIATENAETGVMETDWSENRAKLPQDGIRNLIGRVLDTFYDTGERDRFRTRIERTATGSEIYITHRGMEEVFTANKDGTVWRSRPSDPQLEAEFLSRLLTRLGTKEDVARPLVANAPDAAAAPRARAINGSAGAALEVDEPFDRAWRRVGLALDRSGFTVEDRDRTAGMYFVRYIDPKITEKGEPNFISRLFSSDSASSAPVRLRVAVRGAGDNSSKVSVLNNAGAAETGSIGQQIITRLVEELR